MIFIFANACRSEVVETAPADTGISGDVVLNDANNYTYSGAIDAPSFALRSLTSVTLDWSALQTDIRCNALDPIVDIDNAALLGFPYLSETEVEAGLAIDALEQVDLGVYLSYEPGDSTSVSLEQFTFFGTDADIEQDFYEGAGTFLVLLTTGTTLAVGTRMLAFITPDDDGPTTTAYLDDGCAVLDFDADLASAQAVPIRSAGPWRLDWSALTRTGNGGTFEPTRIDSLMLARFDESVAELAADFLDIEALAEQTWTFEVTGGTTLEPTFEPLSPEGTWILALRCGSCPNPAPPFLAVLAPG